MTVRTILQIGDPILATPANDVDVDRIRSREVQEWIEDMIDTMRDSNGAGIAANQIGIPRRLFVMEVGSNPRYPYKPPIPLTVVINPTIKFLSEETFESNEGCLSVPQIRANVSRYLEIEVSYFDANGDANSQQIRGYSACTWQHEYDHLDGVLFPHRVTDLQSFCSWSMFQKHQQNEYASKVTRLVEQWGA